MPIKVESDFGLSTTSEIFAKNIFQLRKSFSISQNALAQRLGVNPTTISHWESGRSIPSGETIDEICSVFSINPSQLFESDSRIKTKENTQTTEMSLNEALRIINNFDGLLSIRKRHKKDYNK